MTKSMDNQPDEATHRGGFGEFAGEATGLIDRSFREQIVLVGVQFPGASDDEVDANLNELAQLVDTAGADPVDRVIQKRETPDPATYVGKGKAAEIQATSEGLDADTVVFDDELSPGQQFNLEKILKRTALDRTAVILDIFAQNATTLEGKTCRDCVAEETSSANRPAVLAQEDRAKLNLRWIDEEFNDA